MGYTHAHIFTENVHLVIILAQVVLAFADTGPQGYGHTDPAHMEGSPLFTMWA